MSRRRRVALWLLGLTGGLALIVITGGLAIVSSAWFRGKVLQRIVYETEHATGGKVDIGRFAFDWRTMKAEVAPFVLHGTEPQSEAPLFRATSVAVGLKIISILKRDVDIDSLVVSGPSLNLLVDANGRTNLPEPAIKRPSTRNPVEQLIALSVRHITLKEGALRYGDQRVKIDLRGENLNASLFYNFSNPHYEGDLSMRNMRLDSAHTLPLGFDLTSKVALYGNRIQILQARASMPHSQLEGSGEIVDFRSPHIKLELSANGSLAELAKPLRLPIEPEGTAQFRGHLTYNAQDRLQISGKAEAQGIGIKEDNLRINNASLAGDVHLGPEGLSVFGATAHLLGGTFKGSAQLPHLDTYKVQGEVAGIQVGPALQAGGLRLNGISGVASGPVQLSGTLARNARDLKLTGKLQLRGTQGGLPLNGAVDLAYDRRGSTLALGKSDLHLPGTDITFDGTLGKQLNVVLDSRNLNDLLPALAMLSPDAPKTLPIELKGGTAHFEGDINGPLAKSQINGKLTLNRFEVQDQAVDSLTATLAAGPTSLHVDSFAAGQGALRLNGTLDLGLQNWRLTDASTTAAKLRLEGAQVAKLLTNTGKKLPIDGTLRASIDVTGTFGSPKAVLQVNVDKPSFYGETFDTITAEVRYAGPGVEVINGVVKAGGAQLNISGAYEHAPNQWTTGRLRFDASSNGLQLQQVATLQQIGPSGKGRATVKAKGVIDVRNGEFFPVTLDGNIDLRELIVDDRPVGSFRIDAATTGKQLKLTVAGNMRGSQITGGGTFELDGDYPGNAEMSFSPMTLSTVQDLLIAARGQAPLPLEGFVGGRLTFNGPVKKPDLLKARLELSTLSLRPTRRTVTRSQAQDLSLQNEGPVVIEYSKGTAQIQSAHLTGKESDLRATGFVHLNNPKAPWDLKVDGTLNLGVLQSFNNDIVSSGGATLNASLRGSLNNPQLSGRLDLNKASFYITDVPNGLDDANGTILFDTNRATIEKLTATTGGGTIALSGFVGFGGAELSYRVQARADSVRVRYPEGVSTTLNAQLSLTGTSAHSLLAGVLTVRRAGFNPRTDVGGLLAASAKPIASPITPNEFLRGMQLDVRVESAPNLQFQTSLTQDLQAEAELRLRGTAAKPAVLGRVIVNQGEVQFFGNKYAINRGEVGFYNPVSIEPVLDLDLETKVRGITVNISVSGSLKKLNVSYRSDPPLQSTEIIALLAVGRTPQSTSSLAATQTSTNQGILAGGGNSLLGQAVATPVSSRLQRFFGVSRLRIDPQLTGLNAVPQARLTVEQQISKDVTLTYITNLAQANQQIIRLEWDISRNWSVVALREENGAFGIDFFFKKRFR